MNLTALLKELTAIAGVSGSEMSIAKTAEKLLAPFCDSVEIKQGNVIGTLGKRESEKPHVLLDAHMDQIGFLVTAITEDGFVHVGNAGGLDFRLMPAQRVLLHGKKTIPGVICCVPPHLQNEEAHVQTITELTIDTGYSRPELENILAPGDAVSFDMPFRQLASERVTSPSLDDRCGMAAILMALQQVQGESLPCSVSVLFSTQEELGERGAKIGAYAIDPDIALAVDVSFALGHGDEPQKCGKMGGGPMIGISPSLSANVSQDLIAAAEAEHIPWQPEVMSGMTGTNADRFSVTRSGVCAGTVSIPLRYMHTPSEVIQLSDVTETARLLAAYLRRCHVC